MRITIQQNIILGELEDLWRMDTVTVRNGTSKDGYMPETVIMQRDTEDGIYKIEIKPNGNGFASFIPNTGSKKEPWGYKTNRDTDYPKLIKDFSL